ncbi:MAG: dihydrofolate reductase family protein [Thermoplasmata archaeon]|nr:dihydrofolate reductase family protein [Thermoplasmata archaeon]
MRRLIAWDLVTLDGYFEGPTSWDLGFHELVWGPEMEAFAIEQLRTVGTLLFGRVTYLGMAKFWTSERGEIAELMNSIPKVVCSRTLDRVDWNNTSLVKGDAVAEVARLKKEPGRDIFLFGSAALTASLTKAGQIDEFRLALVPVVLGAGNPFFKPSLDRVGLTLLEAKPLRSGAVILRYEPIRKA